MHPVEGRRVRSVRPRETSPASYTKRRWRERAISTEQGRFQQHGFGMTTSRPPFMRQARSRRRRRRRSRRLRGQRRRRASSRRCCSGDRTADGAMRETNALRRPRRSRRIEDAEEILGAARDARFAPSNDRVAPHRRPAERRGAGCKSAGIAIAVTTTAASAASIIACRRSAGYSGSSGTYPAPDFATASSEMTELAERSKQTATRDPGPTPHERKERASPFARALSSAYVSSRAPSISASSRGRPPHALRTLHGCACDRTGARYRSRR